MVDMHEQMKEQLLKHGKISPDDELSKREIQKLYTKYQFEMMRADAAKPRPPKKKPARKTPAKSSPAKTTNERIKVTSPQPREALKFAIEQLLTIAKGANYCMTVGGDGWVNLRYKKSKDSLYFQVAGNKYIAPLRVDQDEIKKLEKLGIKAEPMSDDIFSTLFDDKPRDIDRIVDIIFEIFNDIYRLPEGRTSYITLDLGAKASAEVKAAATKGLMEFLPKRRNKNQFYWNWEN